MISKEEKKYLIFKIILILFASLFILSVLRTLLFYDDLLNNTPIFSIVIQEFSFSILSAIFIASILYVLINEEIQEVNTKAINYAFTDALTGLYNRHYLNDFLDKFTSLGKEDSSFAVVFIDIDRFKEVNDTLGHSTGDCILKSLAKEFKSSIGSGDILCRYGGEEFIIILNDILKDEALKKVDQIRINIQNTSFACKGENITISAGISFGSKSDDIREIMEHSDSALYMAKDAGRNCVRVFEAG